jgi:regulator of protease activity HflC (stomatin/prohibitin superfamily)
MHHRSFMPSRAGYALVMVLCAVLPTACSYARVGSGEIAVIRTPDGMSKEVYTTGDHRIGMEDTATKYSIRSQEREEQLEVLASNGLSIILDTSIRFHIVAAEAVSLDQELGPEYYSVLLGPTLRSQSRRVVGRFQPEEIYSTQREQIEREIREGIETAIKGRHVVLEAVLIRNVRLPVAIQTAITEKLEAEQKALKMKYVIAESEAENQKQLINEKGEAERRKIDSQARADAVRIEAEAAGDAKRSDGKATADYNETVKKSLSPALIRLREIEAWKDVAKSPNSKLIISGDALRPPTVVDIRGADVVAK